MKIERFPRFWSHGAITGVRRAELVCWIAALVLLLGLVATTRAPQPGLLVASVATLGLSTGSADGVGVPRRCIKRVTDLSPGQPDSEVVNRILSQCFRTRPAQPTAAIDSPVLTCDVYPGRLRTARLAPVAGCLLD
jgi:hypothetical protein